MASSLELADGDRVPAGRRHAGDREGRRPEARERRRGHDARRRSRSARRPRWACSASRSTRLLRHQRLRLPVPHRSGSADGCTTSTGRFNQVVRVTMSADTVPGVSLTRAADRASAPTAATTTAAALRIGPDGKLWARVGDSGIGDGGGPGAIDQPLRAGPELAERQDPAARADGAPAAGNPFIGTPGARPEVYAYGFRNPFRFELRPASPGKAVGRRRRPGHARGDRHRAGGRQLLVAATARARCPRVACSPATWHPSSTTRTPARRARHVDHRRRVRAGPASG